MGFCCGICNKRCDHDMYKCPKCDIEYCSLKCYRNATHMNCVDLFRVEDLNKIVKIPPEGVSFENYEKIVSEIRAKSAQAEGLDCFHSGVDNTFEAGSEGTQNSKLIDFGDSESTFDLMSKEKKNKFLDFVENVRDCKSLNQDCWMLMVSQPWWKIVYEIDYGVPVEEVSQTKVTKRDVILHDVLPRLIPNFENLSLAQMNPKAHKCYNFLLAMTVHRVLLIYIVLVRIYGNRLQSVNVHHIKKMNLLMGSHLTALVPSLTPSRFSEESLKKFYSKYEQLLENFEVDTLYRFPNDWNYNGSFTMSEQFFLEVYNDYILILSECYNEEEEEEQPGESNTRHKVPFLWLALSDIYYIFYGAQKDKPSRANPTTLTLKKIRFLAAWCKQHSQADHFQSILNYLQFRCEYLKNIVNHHKMMSKEEVNRLKPSHQPSIDSSQPSLLDEIARLASPQS